MVLDYTSVNHLSVCILTGVISDDDNSSMADSPPLYAFTAKWRFLLDVALNIHTTKIVIKPTYWTGHSYISYTGTLRPHLQRH